MTKGCLELLQRILSEQSDDLVLVRSGGSSVGFFLLEIILVVLIYVDLTECVA